LQVYSHLFAARDHADSAREALDASHSAINGGSASDGVTVVTAVVTSGVPSG
jgi:hypothetical protein